MTSAQAARHILGVRPDLIVEIREDILREKDGPMLVHGLQGFQGSQILIPTRQSLQPDRDFLAERYAFQESGLTDRILPDSPCPRFDPLQPFATMSLFTYP